PVSKKAQVVAHVGLGHGHEDSPRHDKHMSMSCLERLLEPGRAVLQVCNLLLGWERECAFSEDRSGLLQECYHVSTTLNILEAVLDRRPAAQVQQPADPLLELV